MGIEVDEVRDRLVVGNSDRSVFQSGGAGQAKLGVYNLTTGERIAMVDMAARSKTREMRPCFSRTMRRSLMTERST